LEDTRAQTTLDRLAQGDVLLLHLIHKPDKIVHLCIAYRVGETVVVDRERVALVHRCKGIERDIARAWIDVDSDVRPELGIKSLAHALANLVEVVPARPG